MMPRHAAISDLEEAINRLGRPPSLNYLVHADSKDSGTIWATIARRVQELEAERDLLQKQKEWQRQDLERVATLLGQLTSRAAMTQVLVEALRGSKWTMDEQELANIVSRAMAEMNKIAAQRPQQAVDRPSPFTPVP